MVRSWNVLLTDQNGYTKALFIGRQQTAQALFFQQAEKSRVSQTREEAISSTSRRRDPM